MKGLKALVGVGLLVSTFLIGSKGKAESIKPENAGEPVRSEFIQSEPVRSEFIQSEPVRSEFIQSEPVRPENVENKTDLKLLYDDGTWVQGKIGETEITYFSSDNAIHLILEKGSSRISITDGRRHGIRDGNLNYFSLESIGFRKYFFCKDNGDSAHDMWLDLTEEEAKKLRKWGNEKLYEIHKICRERFGDKLKIPYGKEKVEETPTEISLDDILKDFEF